MKLHNNQIILHKIDLMCYKVNKINVIESSNCNNIIFFFK